MMNLAELDFQKIIVWVLIWLFGYAIGLIENRIKDRSKNTEEKVKIIEAPPKLIEEDYALAVFEEGEKVHLKLGRTPIPSKNDISEEQRKRLISLIVRLRSWLDGSTAPTRPIATQTPATPAHVNLPSQPVNTQEIEVDVKYEKLGLVGQINWFLQKKLENHPLKPRNIRLESTPTGGMKFMIGNETFEFIDEIPYPEIKTLIEEARSEWESHSTPGL